MRSRRVLLTVIAIIAVIASGTSLIRTVRTFYRLDFPVSWVEEGLVIDEVPVGSSAESAALAPGDMVVEVDGVSVVRLDDPAFVLAGGDEHVLGVRHGDEFLRDLLDIAIVTRWDDIQQALVEMGIPMMDLVAPILTLDAP